MTTLQQALINAKLAKDQTTQSPTEKVVQSQELELPTLGTNKHGNRQYYLDGECVCPNCLERYTNVLLGDECDLCQIQESQHVVY